jgi:hypothetical protein
MATHKEAVMDKTFYDMLVKNAAEASQRARWILTLVITVSLIQVGALYNFGFSDTREYVESLVFEKGLPKNADPSRVPVLPGDTDLVLGDGALAELRKEMIKSWVDEQTVDIGLLGIKLHATDAGLFGSLALLSVVVWLYYALRRENRIIRTALGSVGREPQAGLRTYVFHALASSQMFAALDPLDDDDRDDSLFGRRVGPWLVTFLTSLPLLTMALMVYIDYNVVFTFRSVHRGFPMSMQELRGGSLGAWTKWTFVLELLCMVLIAWLCWRIVLLQAHTKSRLETARKEGWDRTTPEPQSVLSVSSPAPNVPAGEAGVDLPHAPA